MCANQPDPTRRAAGVSAAAEHQPRLDKERRAAAPSHSGITAGCCISLNKTTFTRLSFKQTNKAEGQAPPHDEVIWRSAGPLLSLPFEHCLMQGHLRRPWPPHRAALDSSRRAFKHTTLKRLRIKSTKPFCYLSVAPGFFSGTIKSLVSMGAMR